MAIETRLLQAKDIDTGEFVNLDVQVTLEDEADQKVKQIVHHTPDIINGSRRRRIATGSGTTVQEVNQLLAQFKQMQKLMKSMGKGGKMPQLPMGMG